MMSSSNQAYSELSNHRHKLELDHSRVKKTQQQILEINSKPKKDNMPRAARIGGMWLLFLDHINRLVQVFLYQR